MEHPEERLTAFMKGAFFQKYKNTYFSDSILKDVFGIKLRKHAIRLSDYAAVFEKDLEVMRDFLEYAKNADGIDKDTERRMLSSLYIDPDGKDIQTHGGIPCSADGLISLRRLYRRYGMTEKLLEDYRKYRSVPIIHFPTEANGINPLRAAVFGDRIDHTLYDLKQYCNGAGDCRLQSAYDLSKTKSWLASFEFNFGEIVKWMKIDGIFVGEDNEVFDLECGDDTFISQYKARYTWEWSDAYYSQLTNRIENYCGEKTVVKNPGAAEASKDETVLSCPRSNG